MTIELTGSLVHTIVDIADQLVTTAKLQEWSEETYYNRVAEETIRKIKEDDTKH